MTPGRRRTGAAEEAAPVEIELDGVGASHGAHDVVLAGPDGRSRWWAGGIAVAAVALVVAAVATGADEAAGPPTTSDRPASTAASRAATSTAATFPAATVTVPDTTAPPTSFRIGEGLLLGEPTGLGLLVSTNGGTYRVDLDASTVTRTPLPPTLANLVATPVGLLWTNEDGTTVLHPGGSEPEVLLPGAAYLGEGPIGRAWFRFATDDAVSIWYQDAGGPRMQAVLPPDAGRALIDGAGGLLAEAGGGVYRVASDGSAARFAVGTLLAAGAGQALIRSCDEALRCEATLVDVATGSVRPGPVVKSSWWSEGAALSPDGQTVIVVDIEVADPRLVAYPFGEPVDLGVLPLTCLSQGCSSAPQWSPDGRWMFWPSFGEVLGWRAGLDAPIALRIPRATSLSDRPWVAIATLDRLRQLDGAG